jgi:shikimate 5-dehydrogenase
MGTSLDSYDLIIQTTPSGAFDQYAASLNSATGKLLECLYKPWPTPLAARFAELGGTVISGKELLVEQALFQIELFTQMKFDFAKMRQALLAHISSD